MLKFDRQGLIPTVVQDDATNEVLMVAFMNEEAFDRTRTTGYTHFFSRSRNLVWRKGEQSGNVQEVRAIFVNCEENSLLIRVVQHGDAACHTGHRSCYYRRLLPDGTYETVAERLFDPDVVYGTSNASLEAKLRQLYGIYLYLRDHDLSEESNTSRLLQERSQGYLVARLADELQELAGVLSGEHIHTGRQPDTILEASQVEYWLLLLAGTRNLRYDDFAPHSAILRGYSTGKTQNEDEAIEQRQNCLNMLNTNVPSEIAQGLQLGFDLIGQACADGGVSPLAPAEYDLEQMQRKGLTG